jgi:hypothetical protein
MDFLCIRQFNYWNSAISSHREAIKSLRH